jgi:hypothetical protein
MARAFSLRPPIPVVDYAAVATTSRKFLSLLEKLSAFDRLLTKCGESPSRFPGSVQDEATANPELYVWMRGIAEQIGRQYSLHRDR